MDNVDIDVSAASIELYDAQVSMLDRWGGPQAYRKHAAVQRPAKSPFAHALPPNGQRMTRERALARRTYQRPYSYQHLPHSLSTSFESACARRVHALVRPLPKSVFLMTMRTFTAVVERDADTGLFVGHIPGWPGAHSQGATVDELLANLQEVVALLLEDGEPKLEAEFVGTHMVQVG
jgi:predicted RNase H-like HicB family nuclease